MTLIDVYLSLDLAWFMYFDGNTPVVMSLETVLQDLFIPKDADIARDLLIKYDLQEVLKRAIERLNDLKTTY